MAVGDSNFERLRFNALKWHPASAERAAWMQIFLASLTQISSLAAFPSYNVVLGFWGLYSVFAKSQEATHVYVGLLCLSILLDMIFCSIWGSNSAGVFDAYTAKFCLAMLIFNVLAKCAAVYTYLRYLKELQAGASYPRERSHTGAALIGTRGDRRGNSVDVDDDIGPAFGQKERVHIDHPDGDFFSAGSAASMALSPRVRRR